MNTKFFALTAVVGVLAAVGCAQPEETDAPNVTDDGVGEEAILYSTNADGTWSANATGTAQDSSYNQAYATFTGPAGKTRKMGVCLLKKYGATVCNSVADCGAAPSTLPTGGYRYCAAPSGSTTKYCYYRPGSQAAYCAGTPANGGYPIAAGSLATPPKSTGKGTYMSYACFEGCLATDPSVSSDERVIVEKVMCGSVYC